MPFFKPLQQKRNLPFLLSIASIIFLLAFFFASYFFYHVPRNRENIHRNAFLILKSISDNMQERDKLLEKNYDLQFIELAAKKKYRKSIDKSLKSLLDKARIGGHVILNNSKRDSTHHFRSGEGYITAGSKNEIVYLYQNSNQNPKADIDIEIPVTQFLEPILSSQRSELLTSYLLVDVTTSNKPRLVYNDPGLALRPDIFSDSLFSKERKAMFSDVRDMQIGGIPYKMFSYPFRLEDQNLVLCGFVETNDYNTQLRQIPTSFIFTIIIIFLITIIFLPVIKFYVIGPDEKLKMADLFLFSLSFFIGPALITLIIVNIWLLWGEERRTKKDLESLSEQIGLSFNRELLRAYDQLDSLDKLISSKIPKITEPFKDRIVTTDITDYLHSHKKDPGVYFNFDRVSWIDSAGWQRIKGELTGDTIFRELRDRKFFKVFENNEPYLLPGRPDSAFAIEAVYNKMNGEYSIIIARKSRLQGVFLTTMVTKLYTLTHPIVPAGFGFCVVDQDGQVQAHSNAARNLHENFPDKVESPRLLNEAMKGRQTTALTGVKFYGKIYSLYVKPLAHLPFSLITFYDTAYQIPAHLRILVVALLFCFFSFLICLVIFFFISRERYYGCPVYYAPLNFFHWIIPKQKNILSYQHSLFFLVAYILFLLFYIFRPVANDSTIVLLVLLTPVNVIATLYVFYYKTNCSKKGTIPEHLQHRLLKPGYIICAHLLISLLMYGLAEYKNYAVELISYFLFQLSIPVFLLYYSFGRKVVAGTAVQAKDTIPYLKFYSWAAVFFIFCIGVLPAALYSWFAYKQELTQSVKQQQLYLAEEVLKRKDVIRRQMQFHSLETLSAGYLDSLQYKAAIYSTHNDIISRNENDTCKGERRSMSGKDGYERLYFAITNNISNNYDDEHAFPALEDAASDHSWDWLINDTAILFWYHKGGFRSNESKRYDSALRPQLSYVSLDSSIENFREEPKSKGSSTGNTFLITSKMPLKFEKPGLSQWLLLLFVLGVIYALFQLIQTLSERIFLRKIIMFGEGKKKRRHYRENLINEYRLRLRGPLNRPLRDEIGTMQKGDGLYVRNGNKELMYINEGTMLSSIDKYRDFFDFLWEECSDKEKHQLYDFACDGLINFKNSREIYSLIGKGIFKIDNEHEEIKWFHLQFRAYILLKKKDKPEQIKYLESKFEHSSALNKIRIPVFIILFALVLFIFITQEEKFDKMVALLTGVTSILTVMIRLLIEGRSNAAGKK